MPTLNLQVSASADDHYQDSGNATGNPSLAGLVIGTGTAASSPDRSVWMRFTNVTIPQGATISSAVLKMAIRTGRWGQTTGTIYGEDVDSAAARSAGFDITAITLTTATAALNENVNKNTANVYHTIPNGGTVTSIVQEIIDRPGWASGNALAIAIIGDGASSFASDEMHAYDSNASLAPTLDITYVLPTETIRPDGAISNAGSWTASGAATLHEAIGETSASNTEYAESPSAPSSATFEVSLGNPSTVPDVDTDHSIIWRLGKSAAGGATETVAVALYQGASLIQSFSRAAPDAFTEYTESVTSGNAANITDYDDLRLRFTATESLTPILPTVRSVGAVGSGTTSATPGAPGSSVAGDLWVTVVTTSGHASAVPAMSTYSGPFTIQTGTALTDERIAIFYKIVGSGETATAVTGGTNHTVARTICITAGTFDATTPIHANSGGNTQASTTSVSITGLTTTVDNCLIIAATAGSLPDSPSTTEYPNVGAGGGWANASLTNLVEQADNYVNTGNGGGIGVLTGTRATAGTVNATTVTKANAALNANYAIAIAPATPTSRTARVSYAAVSFPEGSGPGTPTLTIPHLSSAATLTAPTLTPGSVTLTVPHLSSGATLTAPTMTATATITVPHLASAATLSAPTITPGSATITVPHLSSTATLTTPTLTPGAVTLTVPHLSSSATLAAPTIEATTSLTIPHLSSSATLTAPTITAGAVSLTIPHLASASTLTAPTIAPGAATLTIGHLVSSATLTAPSVTPGAVTFTVPHLSTSATLTAPTITPGSVTLTVAHLGSAAQLFAPTLDAAAADELTIPHLSSSAVLHDPTLTPGAVTLTIAHLSSSATLHAPTLESVAADTLTIPHLASSAVLYDPTVTPGAVTLSIAHLAASATLYTPLLDEQAADELTIPHLASAASLTAPSILPGTVALTIPHLPSGATLSAPTITATATLTIPHLTGVSTLYDPVVLPGVTTLTIEHLASGAVLYAPTLRDPLALPTYAVTAVTGHATSSTVVAGHLTGIATVTGYATSSAGVASGAANSTTVTGHQAATVTTDGSQ